MSDSDGPAAPGQRSMRPWPAAVFGGLAILSSVSLCAMDCGALVMGSWDTVQPGQGWLKADAAVNVALAVIAAWALLTGLAVAARRRTAAAAAVVVILAGFGLFVAAARLAAGAA